MSTRGVMVRAYLYVAFFGRHASIVAKVQKKEAIVAVMVLASSNACL